MRTFWERTILPKVPHLFDTFTSLSSSLIPSSPSLRPSFAAVLFLDSFCPSFSFLRICCATRFVSPLSFARCSSSSVELSMLLCGGFWHLQRDITVPVSRSTIRYRSPAGAQLWSFFLLPSPATVYEVSLSLCNCCFWRFFFSFSKKKSLVRRAVSSGFPISGSRIWSFLQCIISVSILCNVVLRFLLLSSPAFFFRSLVFWRYCCRAVFLILTLYWCLSGGLECTPPFLVAAVLTVFISEDRI